MKKKVNKDKPTKKPKLTEEVKEEETKVEEA